MRISLFSKVIWDHPLEEALRLTAEAGYDGIELIGASPHLTTDIDPERLRAVEALSASLHLPIVNIPSYVGRYPTVDHAEAERRFEQFKRFVHIADALGCRYVRHLPANISAAKATDGDWTREMEWVHRVASYAAHYGINIILEMHHGSLIETADSTRKYLRMAGVKNIAVTFDVGNLYMGHADYGPKAFEKIERYVYIIHVRNHAPWGADGKAPGTMMGDGAIDYVPILEHLREIGFDGYLSAECELFARATAARIRYPVPTTDLPSEEIIRREYWAIRALRDHAMAGDARH